MSLITDRLLPELGRFESNAERNRVLVEQLLRPRTCLFTLGGVLSATGLLILWDKVVAPLSPGRSVFLLYGVFVVIAVAVVAVTRQDLRRRLRAHLAGKGEPICIPCGYDLTGNESGTCPECGVSIASPRDSAHGNDAAK